MVRIRKKEKKKIANLKINYFNNRNDIVGMQHKNEIKKIYYVRTSHLQYTIL